MDPDTHAAPGAADTDAAPGDPARADLHDEQASPMSDEPGRDEPGQSTGDVLTMCLFGVMVVIASICLVIW